MLRHLQRIAPVEPALTPRASRYVVAIECSVLDTFGHIRLSRRDAELTAAS